MRERRGDRSERGGASQRQCRQDAGLAAVGAARQGAGAGAWRPPKQPKTQAKNTHPWRSGTPPPSPCSPPPRAGRPAGVGRGCQFRREGQPRPLHLKRPAGKALQRLLPAPSPPSAPPQSPQGPPAPGAPPRPPGGPSRPARGRRRRVPPEGQRGGAWRVGLVGQEQGQQGCSPRGNRPSGTAAACTPTAAQQQQLPVQLQLTTALRSSSEVSGAACFTTVSACRAGRGHGRQQGRKAFGFEGPRKSSDRQAAACSIHSPGPARLGALAVGLLLPLSRGGGARRGLLVQARRPLLRRLLLACVGGAEWGRRGYQ